MSAEKGFDDAVDGHPIAVTLSFKDWGQMVGALNAMFDMLDPKGELVVNVRRWSEEIRKQVVQPTIAHFEKEAANEDAN